MNGKISNCLVIAHRGDTQHGVENTLPAFESALKLGVGGIEMDLRLTRDERIVIFHDKDLKRLSGQDDVIEKSLWHDLKKIKFQGTSIPTLEEVLSLVGDKVFLNLEIKTFHCKPIIERRLIQTLKDFRLNASILVSSFQPLNLRRMRSLAPSLSCGYLFERHYWPHRFFIPFINPDVIVAPLCQISPSFVEFFHRKKKKVFTWTVNEEGDMKVCLESGVDAIITDQPAKLMTLLNSF